MATAVNLTPTLLQSLIESSPDVRKAVEKAVGDELNRWQALSSALSGSPAPKRRGRKPGKKAAAPKPKARKARAAAAKAKPAAAAKPRKRSRKAKDGRKHGEAILHVLGLKKFAEGDKSSSVREALATADHPMDANTFNTTITKLVEKGLVEKVGEAKPYTWKLPASASE